MRHAPRSRFLGGTAPLLVGWLAAVLLGACHRTPVVVVPPVPAAPPSVAPAEQAEPAPAPDAPPAGDPPLGIVEGPRPPRVGTRVTCPVCGDTFTVEPNQPVRHHKGKTLVFCCERCLPHFDKNPDLFTDQ